MARDRLPGVFTAVEAATPPRAPDAAVDALDVKAWPVPPVRESCRGFVCGRIEARGGVRCRGPRGAGRTRAAPRGCTCAGRTGGRRRHSRYSSAPWQSSSGSRAPDRARQPPCIGRALRRTDTRHRPIASPGRCSRRGNAGGPRPPPEAGISRRCADAKFAGIEGAVRGPGRLRLHHLQAARPWRRGQRPRPGRETSGARNSRATAGRSSSGRRSALCSATATAFCAGVNIAAVLGAAPLAPLPDGLPGDAVALSHHPDRFAARLDGGPDLRCRRGLLVQRDQLAPTPLRNLAQDQPRHEHGRPARVYVIIRDGTARTDVEDGPARNSRPAAAVSRTNRPGESPHSITCPEARKFPANQTASQKRG